MTMFTQAALNGKRMTGTVFSDIVTTIMAVENKRVDPAAERTTHLVKIVIRGVKEAGVRER